MYMRLCAFICKEIRKDGKVYLICNEIKDKGEMLSLSLTQSNFNHWNA